jgi:protein-tyrosine kinase
MTLARSRPRQVTAPAPRTAHKRLGELLHNDGALTEQDIENVLAAQIERGERFGETASRLGIVSEQHVMRALARQAEFPIAAPGGSTLSRELIAAYEPHSARAEALRTLRSELVLRWFGRGNRALAVVEARRGHGGNLLAANLAVVFAQLGEQTLLIDANLRSPTQHTRFGLSSNHGLADIINGRDSLDELVTEVTDFKGLSVLCAGAPVPNPQELLGRHSFAYLIETVPPQFDAVIVDTPPMLEFADARLIAAHTRATLLSTKRHRTSVGDAIRVREELAPTDAILLGAVIEE